MVTAQSEEQVRSLSHCLERQICKINAAMFYPFLCKVLIFIPATEAITIVKVRLLTRNKWIVATDP